MRLLPASLRPWLGAVAGLAALVVLVLGVRYAGDGGPGRVDRWAVPPTADSVRGVWRGIALTVDFLGEPVGAVGVVGVLVAGCLWRRRWRWVRGAVFVVVAPVVTVGVTTVLKHVVGRTIHGDGNLSCPSGHTGFAATVAVAVGLLAVGRLGLGRAAGTLLVLAASLVAGAVMGWAEVALGAHYVTDTVAGWCTALALTPVTAWLIDASADRLGSSPPPPLPFPSSQGAPPLGPRESSGGWG
jgi:undecaprenyl-diphosphatase